MYRRTSPGAGLITAIVSAGPIFVIGLLLGTWSADMDAVILPPGLSDASPSIVAGMVMTILAGRPRASRMMWAKRAQEFQAKINSGDLKSVAEVCRDLQSVANGSAPSYSQRNLFELAIDRLAGEFAGVAGTDKAEAIARLTRALAEGRSADGARADRERTETEATAATEQAVSLAAADV